MIIKKNVSGFSLLEVLITVLLTAVGILGMVAMQSKSIQYTQDSTERTQAVMLADDLMEIIRATPSSQTNDTSGSPFFSSLPTGTEENCLTIGKNDLIETQVSCWASRVRTLLPGANDAAASFSSCISASPGTCDTSGAAVEIRLAWHAAGEGCLDASPEADPSLCLYTLRTQI